MFAEIYYLPKDKKEVRNQEKEKKTLPPPHTQQRYTNIHMSTQNTDPHIEIYMQASKLTQDLLTL